MFVAEITPARERVHVLVRSASVETTARPSAIDEILAAGFPVGTCVYITALPRDNPDAVRDASRRLCRAKLKPIPHLGARYLRTARELESLLHALKTEAEVDQALVVGGDIETSRGPFASSLELLRSGFLERGGIRRVGIAVYPEGHAKIPNERLEDAVSTKIRYVREAGMEPYVISQFCFTAEPIAAWLSRFTQQFADVPIHLGIAGPAAVPTLLKYGLSCGIGPSLRALRRTSLLKIAQATPADLLSALAEKPPVVEKITGFHFFTFGGIARTAEWMRCYARSELSPAPYGNR